MSCGLYMSYVIISNMASAPVDFLSAHFPPCTSPLDRVWTKQVWHEDKGLTSCYSSMLNWKKRSLCEGRNVAVYEPRKNQQLLPHQTFLRRLNMKMRTQVSEQAYHLTFPCGGFLYCIPVWSYNAHKVQPFAKFSVFCL